MEIIKLGDYNKLNVVKKVDFGLYLDGGKAGEILLPSRYVPEGTEIGDELNVFIYLDQEERVIATTEQPLAKVGDFAYLEVKWVNEYGAFLGWGLMKDLFCPFREQKKKMEIGESYIVYVHIDEESYRIVASAKVDKFLSNDGCPLQSGEEADLLVWQKTELGFKVIINNRYSGLVYRDQVFQNLHTGDRLKGFIQNIRPDGKIDVSLQKTGRQQTLDFSDTLLDYIRAHGGYCPFGDKSDAQDIYREFNVSKKVFKKAVGDLYKQRLITIESDGLHLV
jgi:predicted RNA-binding protein (virulence factor B family)